MDVLIYTSAIVITIVGLFFGASFIRNFISKNIESQNLDVVNSYTLGGSVWLDNLVSINVVGNTSLLANWPCSFTFGVCIFLYQKFSKKDAAVEELRMEKRQLHIRIKEFQII